MGSDDFCVYCLTTTGNLLWKYEGDGVPDLSSPAISDGKVYIGIRCSAVCLDADTGDQIWIFYTSFRIRASPAVADGKVYIGSEDHNFFCINSDDGTLIQKYSGTSASWFHSSPAIANGRIYFGSFDNSVYCLAEGDTTTTPTVTQSAEPTIAQTTKPIVTPQPTSAVPTQSAAPTAVTTLSPSPAQQQSTSYALPIELVCAILAVCDNSLSVYCSVVR